MQGRKFDIRVWVLVSSWNPFQVYYFKNCYIRFTAQDYDPTKIKNLFCHLTNNSVNANAKSKFEKIPGNMWFLEQFKSYLDSNFEKGIWNSQLLPQLEDICKLSMLSGWGFVDWREGSIGIYGLDIMIDEDFRMWLIEVNKAPCMRYSTAVTAKLVPEFMSEMVKVVIDKTKPSEKLKMLVDIPFIEERECNEKL